MYKGITARNTTIFMLHMPITRNAKANTKTKQNKTHAKPLQESKLKFKKKRENERSFLLSLSFSLDHRLALYSALKERPCRNSKQKAAAATTTTKLKHKKEAQTEFVCVCLIACVCVSTDVSLCVCLRLAVRAVWQNKSQEMLQKTKL